MDGRYVVCSEGDIPVENIAIGGFSQEAKRCSANKSVRRFPDPESYTVLDLRKRRLQKVPVQIESCIGYHVENRKPSGKRGTESPEHPHHGINANIEPNTPVCFVGICFGPPFDPNS